MSTPTKMVLEAVAEVEQAIARIKQLTATVNELARSVGLIDDKAFNIQSEQAVADLNKLKSSLDRVTQAENTAGNAAQTAGEKIKGKGEKSKQAATSVDALATQTKKAAVALQAFFASIVVQKIKSFVEEIFRAGAAFESYTNTIIAALGSQEAADAAIEHLTKTANTFGVSLETLLQRFGRFKVAADSAGFTLAQTETIFDGFVAVSRALGNTNEQTERTFVALEQIMSKGVVQSEELKQQLGDSLVGAYNKLGAAMGMTGLEFEKALKNNELLARESIPKLVTAYLELAGPAIQKNLTSLNAEIARMENAIFLAKREIAEKAKPEFLEFLRIVKIIGTEGALSFDKIGAATGGLVHKLRDILVLLDSILSLDFASAAHQFNAIFVESIGTVIKFLLELGAKARFVVDLIATGSKESAEAAEQSFRDSTANIRKFIDDSVKFIEDQTAHAKRAAELKVEFEKEANAEVIALQERVAKLQKEMDDEALNRQKELTKEQIKELHKREEAFEQFFAKLADLAKKQPGGPETITAPVIEGGATGDFVTDGQIGKITAADEALRKLNERIQTLQDEKKQLETDPYVTGGQIQRVEEINIKIRQLQAELARAKEVAQNNSLVREMEENAKAAQKAQAAAEKWSQSIQAALVDLVRDNDLFRDSFLRLDTDGQAAVRNLISSFESLAAANAATGSDFNNFLSGLAQIFGQAGVITQEFATQLQGSFGGSAASATELLGILAQLGDATTKAATDATAGAAAVVAAEETKREAVIATGEIFIQSSLEQDERAKQSLATQQQAATESLAAISGASEGLMQAVASGASVMLDTTGTAAEATGTQIAAALAEAGGAATESADEVGKAASDIITAVADTADGSKASITNTFKTAEEKADRFGEVLVDVGSKGEKSMFNLGIAVKQTFENIKSGSSSTAASFDNIISGGSSTAEVIKEVGGSFEKVVEGADATAKAIEKAATATERTATASDKAATSLERTDDAADLLVTALGKVPTAANAASASLKTFREEMQITKTLAVEIGLEIAKWADEI